MQVAEENLVLSLKERIKERPKDENHWISICMYLCTHVCSHTDHALPWEQVIPFPRATQPLDKAVLGKAWQKPNSYFFPHPEWKLRKQKRFPGISQGETCLVQTLRGAEASCKQICITCPLESRIKSANLQFCLICNCIWNSEILISSEQIKQLDPSTAVVLKPRITHLNHKTLNTKIRTFNYMSA